MNNWDQKIKNLGRLKPKTKVDVTYTYYGNKKIKSVKTGCGCTSHKISGNRITFTYNVMEFPKHLEIRGAKTTEIQRDVEVTYEDNTADILTFQGTLYAV